MKNKGVVILSILLIGSIGLNCFLAVSYLNVKQNSSIAPQQNNTQVSTVLSTNGSVGNTKETCKYSGHWTSLSYVPEIYIEDDGSAYAIMYMSKTPNSVDSYDTYIYSLVKGYIEGDKIVFTEKAKIYEPNKLRIEEEGVPREEEYYFHDVSDVTADKWETIALIATIDPATDDAIKVVDFYPRTLDYIKQNN